MQAPLEEERNSRLLEAAIIRYKDKKEPRHSPKSLKSFSDLLRATNEDETVGKILEQLASVPPSSRTCWKSSLPLRRAIDHGDIELLELFLNMGADVQMQNQDGVLLFTIMYCVLGVQAVKKTYGGKCYARLSEVLGVALIKLLLDNGADPNRGCPLSFAAKNSLALVTRCLILNGANPNLPVGRLPLFSAVCQNRHDVVRALLAGKEYRIDKVVPLIPLPLYLGSLIVMMVAPVPVDFTRRQIYGGNGLHGVTAVFSRAVSCTVFELEQDEEMANILNSVKLDSKPLDLIGCKPEYRKNRRQIYPKNMRNKLPWINICCVLFLSFLLIRYIY